MYPFYLQKKIPTNKSKDEIIKILKKGKIDNRKVSRKGKYVFEIDKSEPIIGIGTSVDNETKIYIKENTVIIKAWNIRFIFMTVFANIFIVIFFIQSMFVSDNSNDPFYLYIILLLAPWIVFSIPSLLINWLFLSHIFLKLKKELRK